MTWTPARVLFTVFMVCFALAVTWPAYVPFNRVEPLVLGLPFSMVWLVLWVILSAIVLLLLDRSEERRRGRED
jgi:hypothetical protein